ncbi:bifunctional DNA primase/polymerase [Nocardia sp. NBC_01730]|uniref:bifunctional DNA primase/polymerase n=1 Tax=Nocardia sp. NBC_01730 TaxID=2975998 RepID=UPI002E12EF32|nr:bifunctional DNA primase/polymerase [Nocardia sp. NBC_01730]
MTDLSDLRAAALAAAARGWPVFPLRPSGKKPAIKRWPDLASTDEDRIHRWWGYNPRYNVAVLTGSPAGLHIIDLDARHMTPPAADLTNALARLAECLLRPAPPTLTIATPSGWHLYYRAPNEPPLRCTVARIGDGIDSRGHGGYIVAPGSRTPRGGYTVAENRPVADLPAMLIQRIIPPPLAPAPRGGWTSSVAVAPDSYLAAILAGEAERVARARVHLRNHTLFRSALVLGRLVAADEVSEHDARTVLTAAAAAHIGVEDFTAEEAHRTVSNGFRYSRARPRRLRL